MTRTVPALSALAALGVILAGCTAAPAGAPPTPAGSEPAGHGAVEGAAEMSEAQSRLLAIAGDGSVTMLDLLTEETRAVGTIGAPAAIASDGRYAFVTTEDGVDIVDGGAWTWDHGDHFHYYRADPAVVGSIAGEGPVTVTTPPLSTATSTGLFFAGSGEAVVLDMESLGEGEIVERFRVDTGAAAGIVAPAGEFAIVATASAIVYDETGARVDEFACAEPSGSIVTRVGTVIGCADGAVLVTADGDGVAAERIAYPAGAERATAFAGRKNRPTVAGLTDGPAFLLLDTRERAWTEVAVDAPLRAVVAADDAAENVVALDADGRVRVYGPDGTERGRTDPLTASADATLTVDAQRAYLAAPDAGVVYEIDYADGARVARELALPHALAIEVGR
ncbi:hypothetical protein [Microbacterium sediminis]|uniref:Uncharacterized protein n=1 Tax=Microbacterium sediminis TaxID=904291 RepID=A0A1B9NCU3_9MICO|nr:hypothetical protein [Microbacterium sediminis]OCG74408.1 hypothetical protein A7J15_06155 [Microbacterium sediminis]QBR73778.1 ABC transporter [Microbacterium sediminis]